jgi:hypothetical protein
MLASPSFHDVLNMLAPLVAESLLSASEHFPATKAMVY